MKRLLLVWAVIFGLCLIPLFGWLVFVIYWPTLLVLFAFSILCHVFLVQTSHRWVRFVFIVAVILVLGAVYTPRLKTELALFGLARQQANAEAFDATVIQSLRLPAKKCNHFCFEMLLSDRLVLLESPNFTMGGSGPTKYVRWTLLTDAAECERKYDMEKTVIIPDRYTHLRSDAACIVKEGVDELHAAYSITIDNAYPCFPESTGRRYQLVDAHQRTVHSLIHCEAKVMTIPTLLYWDVEMTGQVEAWERTRETGPESIEAFLLMTFGKGDRQNDAY